MRATRARHQRDYGGNTLWAERACRYRYAAADRAFSIAMCRSLRPDWDVDAAAARVVDLGVSERAVEDALRTARALQADDPTTASARAEATLARALVSMRS